MKSNKGFTLIELLAVIVILAIIALIATPTILGVVDDARKGAAKASVLGYIDAVEKQVMINLMDDEKTNITDGDYTVAQLTTAGVTVKGKLPDKVGAINETPTTDGELSILENQVQDASFEVDGYTIDYTKSTGVAEVRTANNNS